jgi:hypothetical protein
MWVFLYSKDSGNRCILYAYMHLPSYGPAWCVKIFVCCRFSKNCEKRQFASCLSVRMEQLGSHLTDFHEILYLRIFLKSVEKIQVSLLSDRNKGHFSWRPINLLIISCSFPLIMKNVSNKICRENENSYFCSVIFFKLCRLWDNVGKYCRVGQATVDKMAHAHCMLDT